MKRRAFLFASGAGVLSAGDAAAAAPAPSDREIRRHVRKLRRDLDRTHDATLQIPVSTDADPERLDLDSALVRSGLRSLLLVAGVADLPEEARAHEDVVALVDELAPEVDFAVNGLYTRLGSLPDADRRAVKRALRDDPSLVERIGADLEAVVARSGASAVRTAHFSGLVRNAIWRIAHQPLDAVLADVLGGAERHAAVVGGHAQARDAIWSAKHDRIHHRWARRRDDDDDVAYIDEATGRRRWSPKKTQRVGEERLAIGLGLGVAGGLLLGLGATASGAGVIIFSLFVLTGAVVMLIAGLITLIVAANRAEQARHQLPP